MQCGILEEQNRKSLESMKSVMQREKSKAQAFQHEVLELKTVRGLRMMVTNSSILK